MSDITTLEKVKVRCGISPADTSQDALLTFFISEVPHRFDRWTGRKLERTEGRTNVFPAESLSLGPDCYPVERVTKWELKENEAGGWVEQPAPVHLIGESGATVSLEAPVGQRGQNLRITYDGGYVFPGSEPGEGQAMLPAGLEEAAVTQCAHLYQLRDAIGVSRVEISTGVHWSMADYVWAPWVRYALSKLRRTEYGGHL
jgi:hypothetical protein